MVSVVTLCDALFGAPCLTEALSSTAVWEKAGEMALHSPPTCLTRTPFCQMKTLAGDLAQFQTTLLQTRVIYNLVMTKMWSLELAPISSVHLQRSHEHSEVLCMHGWFKPVTDAHIRCLRKAKILL